MKECELKPVMLTLVSKGHQPMMEETQAVMELAVMELAAMELAVMEPAMMEPVMMELAMMEPVTKVTKEATTLSGAINAISRTINAGGIVFPIQTTTSFHIVTNVMKMIGTAGTSVRSISLIVTNVMKMIGTAWTSVSTTMTTSTTTETS